ncbi:HMG box domain-containing protein [Mycena chlorophos]|uniref:HMG box domain-containing protein n=1 Tax=Mycena chlorophos TaxID=658473 RepID=A0A8H6WD80_MYCCL|nr:HMG box domain-containing protein [Mycena chlorophos]
MPSRNSSNRRSSSNRGSITQIKREEDLWDALSLSPPSNDSGLDVEFPTPRPRAAGRSSAQHIPRPPNQFICYRSHWWNENKHSAEVVRDHRQVSRLAGIAWKALPDSEKAKFAQQAEIAKQKHADKYPQYHYRPTGRASGSAKSKKRKATVDTDDEDDNDEWVPSSAKRRRVQRERVRSIVPKCESPSAPPTLSLPTPPTLAEDAPTPDLAPDTCSETSEPRVKLEEDAPVALVDAYEDDDGFVLTADIPPLDLYAGSLSSSKKTSVVLACDNPPALQYTVTPQFFKAETSSEARDAFLWCNSGYTNEVHLADELDSDDDAYHVPEFNSDVQFTNPFAIPFDAEFDDMGGFNANGPL